MAFHSTPTLRAKRIRTRLENLILVDPLQSLPYHVASAIFVRLQLGFQIQPFGNGILIHFRAVHREGWVVVSQIT